MDEHLVYEDDLKTFNFLLMLGIIILIIALVNKNEREQIFMHRTKNTILKWKYKEASFNNVEAKVALCIGEVLNKLERENIGSNILLKIASTIVCIYDHIFDLIFLGFELCFSWFQS